MPLFTTAFPFPFPWPAHVYAVMNKYPNPLAPHGTSISWLAVSGSKSAGLHRLGQLGLGGTAPAHVERVAVIQTGSTARKQWVAVLTERPCRQAGPDAGRIADALVACVVVISMDVLSRTLLEDGTIRSERLIGVQQDSPKWVNRLLGSQDVTFVREVSFVVPSSLPHPTDPTLSSTSTSHLEPPKLLMASTNLTLSYLLQCRESISYLPHPWPHAPTETLAALAPLAAALPAHPSSTSPPPVPKAHPLSHPSLPAHTLFSQSALIYSTGIFASNPYPPVGISKASPIEPLSMPRAKTMPQRAAGKKVETWSTERYETNAYKGRAAMEHAARRFWTSEGDQEVAT